MLTRTSSPSCAQFGRAALFFALLAATGVSAGAAGNAGRLEPIGQVTRAPEYCAEIADAYAARQRPPRALTAGRVQRQEWCSRTACWLANPCLKNL